MGAFDDLIPAGPRTHDGLPARQNGDGSHSTELSITVTNPRLNGGNPTNIPSLWGGRELDEEGSVAEALKSGRQWQSFPSIDEAVKAAEGRSTAGGAMATPSGSMFADLIPSSGGPSAGGMQDWEPQGYSGTEMAARKVGLAAQGVNDAFLPTIIGAPVDASAWITRNVPGMQQVAQYLLGPSDATRERVAKLTGPKNLSDLVMGRKGADLPKLDGPVGGSASIKTGIDYVATLPGRVTDAVSQGSTAPLTDSRTSRIEPVTTGERTAYGAGEGVGNALSVAVPAGMVARGAQAGTATQGVANVLASQPVVQTIAGGVGGGVTGATDNPLYGLAASLAVPVAAAGVRGAISPVTNRLSPQEQRLVAGAQQEGIQLTPAQMTGSRSLRAAEETMARMPLSNTPMQAAFETQRGQFNRAVMQRTGAVADDASPDTMQRVFTGLGQVFDDLSARTTVNVDPQFGQAVQRVATNYGRRLETDVAPVFQSYLDDLTPLIQAANTPGAAPQIAGDVYRTMRSDITTRMRETNNLPLRRALGGLVEALDDVMERSTSGALRGEWQEARRNYANLMTIDRAMQGGTQAGRSAGDVPFNALSTAVKGSDRVGYTRGRGDLNQLARIGDYIADKVPNSGTPERLAWQNILTGGGLFTAGAASGIGLPAAAVGAASPWLISRLYNSPAGRAYLTNQLAGNTNFNALYGSTAAQQALPTGPDREPNALRLRVGQ